MNLEEKAIRRIRAASEMSLFHYRQPLVCAYSGGKDSDVLLELFKRSEIPYEVHHSHTTADAPETVRHIRRAFKKLELDGVKCHIEMPTYQGKRVTMWSLIPLKGIAPSRIMRYCCAVLKETGCSDRFLATGVRWAESNNRKERSTFENITRNKKKKVKLSDEIILMNDNDEKRKFTEHCQLKKKSIVNPIIDWTDSQIWQYIRSEKVNYNELYDKGYHRVGCIGCPMAGKRRYKEFADYPAFQRAYIRAFETMLEVRLNKGKPFKAAKTGEEVFKWWMEDDTLEGQMNLFDDNFIP